MYSTVVDLGEGAWPLAQPFPKMVIKDRDTCTLIEQSVKYSNRAVNTLMKVQEVRLPTYLKKL